MALYFYFNETTGDLVYSDQATYSGSGYTSLGEQTNIQPVSSANWIFHSQRANIKTVTKDLNISAQIDILKKMTNMFINCKALTSLDLSGFDTSSVTDMSYMFSGCSALTSLDLSDLDTSNVMYMSNMFGSCNALISLDLSNFDTSKKVNAANIFVYCNSLRIIDISPDMSNVVSSLPAATYYDAVTRQSYTKASIPGGSTYVRDLADLDLVSTMVQYRAAIKAAEHRLNARLRSLQQQIDVLKG